MHLSFDFLFLRDGILFAFVANQKAYKVELLFSSVLPFCSKLITKPFRSILITTRRLTDSFIQKGIGLAVIVALIYVETFTANLDKIHAYFQPVPPAAPIFVTPFGKHKHDKFLKVIAKIESNNGKNINHVVMTTGQHKGTAAYGKWGLMPLTIIGIVQADKTEKRFNRLRGLSVHTVTSRITPEIELLLARRLARTLLSLSNGDELMAAYRWYNGAYSLPTEEMLAESEYVGRYISFTQ